MALRIRVEDLGDEVRESLERGESVEVELDGEVVATIPASGNKSRAEAIQRLGAAFRDLDDEFERDMREARRLINLPVETVPWDE